MKKETSTDSETEVLRQSIIKNKSNKHCLKDFSGEIFNLTPEMLVSGHRFDAKSAKELSGVAECILRKYEKILSVPK